MAVAVAVAEEACVTLCTDWGEPPVSCRVRGLPGCLVSGKLSSGSCLRQGCQGQVTAGAFRVGCLFVSCRLSVCWPIWEGIAQSYPSREGGDTSRQELHVFSESGLCVKLVVGLVDSNRGILVPSEVLENYGELQAAGLFFFST